MSNLVALAEIISINDDGPFAAGSCIFAFICCIRSMRNHINGRDV